HRAGLSPARCARARRQPRRRDGRLRSLDPGRLSRTMVSPLRLLGFALPLAGLALAACQREPALPPGVKLRQEQASSAKAAMAKRGAARDEQGVTAMADRVATLGLLNKRNNLTR